MASKSMASPALFLAMVVLIMAPVHGARSPSSCLAPSPPPTPTPPVLEPTPPPTPPPAPSTPPVRPPGGQCPMDIINLTACIKLNVGGQMINLGPAGQLCCPPMAGLSGDEAVICLCEAFKVRFAPNVGDFITAVVVACGKSEPPPGYKCII